MSRAPHLLIADKPEVEDGYGAPRRDEHVVGLQVPVKLARVVDGADPFGEVEEDAADSSQIVVHVQVVDEGLAHHQIHREEPQISVKKELVQHHQIGVHQIGQGAELLFEAVNPPRARF